MASLASLPAVARAAAADDDAVAAALRLVEPRVHALAASALISAGELTAAGELLTAWVPRALDAVAAAEICDQLLRLADAWTRRGRPAAAEEALRIAVRTRPQAATAALARHLQRRGAVAEALTRWAEAIRLAPADAEPRLALGRLLEAQGRNAEAYATYLEALEILPTAGRALRVAPALERLASRLPEPPPDRAVRIALLGSASLEQLRACLLVEAHRAGLRPQVHLAGFGQYAQELLDGGSELYRFSPDVLVLAIHRSRLFPELSSDHAHLSVEERRAAASRGIDTARGLLRAFRERSSALVLLHGMVVPQNPAMGIADARDELGERAVFTEINSRLTTMARSEFEDVHVLDEDAVQARYGKAIATDPRMWLAAAMPWSEPVTMALAGEHLRYLRARRGPARKCLVLDLDGTLWGGVVGEDGPDGVALGSDPLGNAHLLFQGEVARLRRRGVLLAICSKNDEADALGVFESRPEMVLRLDDFVARRINWAAKPDNVRAIADELGVGLDSIVFWDDSPAERAQMRAVLPEVLTPEVPADPALFRNALAEMTVFDSLTLTREDADRTRFYREQGARRTMEQSYRSAGRLAEYLGDLGTTVAIACATPSRRPRIAQLIARTNQFNLTGRRLTVADIAAIEAAGGRVYAVRVADRFGDSGLAAAAVVGPPEEPRVTRTIDVLVLSCRVLGRGVESALLSRIAHDAREGGAIRLLGRYVPSGRNRAARDVYCDHGFRLLSRDPADGGEWWELELESSSIEVPGWLEVRTVDGPAAAIVECGGGT